VVNDIPAIRAAIDSVAHPALLMVDTIASLGTMTFTMDEWGVDVAVCGAQKGLMTPPGLSFCAAGRRALSAHETAGLCTRYWDWTFRRGEAHYHKYCGTPPEHMLFGLDEALRLLQQEGFDNAIRRHTLLAGAVRAALEVWSEGDALDFNVTEPAARANSVTTIRLAPPHEPAALLAFCQDTCGVTLGLGIGGLPGFRIAHMGHINAPMILGTLGCVELGLKTLGIPHGHGGLQAAVEALATTL
jgi:alanine-glyoxylate transaminase/serine-glyoxylate transaminase/serine-pyruvate transaminase